MGNIVKPAGGWASETEAAKLTASDGTFDDFLGQSVAVSGNTVVAGAPGAQVSGGQGAVYVFLKPGGGWASETEVAKLTASDGGGQLGGSVAFSGDTVVAGDVAATVNGRSQGGAYVFVKPAGGWASETETAKLTASDGAALDDLGLSLAMSGNTVVAGAPNVGQFGPCPSGAVYVFVEPAGGWTSETESAKLTATGEALGNSLAFSGNTLVTGGALLGGRLPFQGGLLKLHGLQACAAQRRA